MTNGYITRRRALLGVAAVGAAGIGGARLGKGLSARPLSQSAFPEKVHLLVANQSTITPRCSQTAGSTTASSAVTPALTSWINEGLGFTGTAPAAGDLAIIIITVNSNSISGVTQTAGTPWTIEFSDANGGNGGLTTCVAWRVWEGTETAPTFTWGTNLRNTYTVMALAPYGAHLISPDAWAVKKIDSASSTTHTPNPANATDDDLSLIIAGALASAVGTSPLTYAVPEGWTIPAGASGGIPGGTTSGKSMGAVLCYQQGVTGTVTPGAMTIEGGSTATGTTNANLYHVVIKAPRQYKVGAYINPAVYGTGVSTAQAITNFQSTTGRTLEAHRIYYGVSGFPTSISTDMKADVDAGRKICLSLRPPYNPVSSPVRDQLATFLASCQSYGAVMDVALWHEPYFADLTADQFIAMFQYYGPTIRAAPYPAVFCTSVSSAWSHNENSYWPGDSYVDKVATDFYPPAYFTSGARLGGGTTQDAAYHADTAAPPKPFGIWEFFTSLDTTHGQTQAQADEFWGYIRSYMADRASSGKANADILAFDTSNVSDPSQDSPMSVNDGETDPYSGTTEYRNALYDAVFDGV
jgi:beta-mannanase